jgi:predicted TIM-barrel fold metal-dependent hydrolase
LKIRVIDTQVHLHHLLPIRLQSDCEAVIEAGVVAMNAVGVDGVVIDEWTGWAGTSIHSLPGHKAANGAWRSDHPLSEAAVERYPNRFAYLTRVDPFDPEIRDVVAEIRSNPAAVAIRLTPAPTGFVQDDPAFSRGGYADLFAAADEHRVPLLVPTDGVLSVLRPYVERFHRVPIVLDHCGINYPRRDTAGWDLETQLAPVRELARYPNVLVKWEHVERMSDEGYPFQDVVVGLRGIVDAFGAQRVMWGSDNTMAVDPSTPYRRTCTWAQTLGYIADSELLATVEKEWILGRTAQVTFGWPEVAVL